MGLPLKTIKDNTRQFPIQPLTVYVMSDYLHPEHKRIFDLCLKNPPFSLIPVDYTFISRKHEVKYEKKDASKQSKLDELSQYNIVAREAEKEECFDPEQTFSDSSYPICYMCGKTSWGRRFDMDILFFTHILLDRIKNHAKELIALAQYEESIDESRINAARMIIKICDQSMEVLFKKSNENLRPKIEEMRHWLDLTAIMRKIPEDISEESVKETFKSGDYRKDYYGIVIKKKNESNVYQINLKVGPRLYPIESKEQCINLYLFAIAFATKGEPLKKEMLLRGMFTGSAVRKGIATMYNCYCAMNGIDIGGLKEALNKPFGFKGSCLSPGFEKYYHQLCLNARGEYDSHKLTRLVSRLNNIGIKAALNMHPEEVQELFKLKFKKPARGYGYYYLDIPPENIVIE